MTTISLWDPDRIWVSCKNCGQWSDAPVSSGGRAGACSNCRKPIEIPTTGQVTAPNSVADHAAIERNRADSRGFIFFLCPSCGRKFSLPNRAEGDFVKCFQCGLIMVVLRVTSIPEPNNHEEEPATAGGGSSPTSEQRCDVVLDSSNQEELRKKGSGQEKCCYCEAPFDETESDYFCPECGLRFHEQCWNENQGCAATGCKMQKSQKHPGTIRIPDPPRPNPEIHQSDIPHAPWQYVLLLGTVILGLVSFVTTYWLNLIGTILSFMVLKNEGLLKGRTGVVKACMTVAIVSFLFSAMIRSI